MDELDDLFFDHRVQKRARVQPLFVSQRMKEQGYLEPPTFNDFMSSSCVNDLASFKLSQLMSQRDTQAENDRCQPMDSMLTPASQFATQRSKGINITKSQTGKRVLPVSSPPFDDEFRRPAGHLQTGVRNTDYGSDDDLFADSTQTKPACRSISEYTTPQALSIPDPVGGKNGKKMKLRSVEELPERYREIFQFPFFNIVQSLVLDDVLYTDKPLVVCAPTGSGKTAVFELAILRLLMTAAMQNIGQVKIIYMAPIKALCSERYLDWKEKFEPFGLKCKELTGDTEMDDYFQLQQVNIVTTTPEKWDSMTRKWRDNKSLVQMVRLFLIDEVHVLNDDTRGATMEAVISRMKTVQSALSWSNQPATALRFIAVSATIPNIEDIAQWLGSGNESAVFHSLGDSYRPVRLRKVVLGYYCSEESSDFKFDISLSYKIAGIIHTYSENKPTLVFCSTRKSVQQSAAVLVKDSKFIMDNQHKERLVRTANRLRDSKLRELILCGVGFHHAGLELQDRKTVEELFTSCDLPVLFATSTLAMGVNLPAHLVVIKSTTHYLMGSIHEYSDTQVLQMIGRAGRPQYDTSATAVIMTKSCNKHKYEALIGGTQLLESSLHKHLIEHLNAEICLKTINDVTVALEWMKSTLLYIRVMKNPKHYDMPVGLTKNQVEKRLQDLCVRNLNLLTEIDLIKMDEDFFDIKATDKGQIMARYCITYTSMKRFSELSPATSLSDMLTVLSGCQEFSDIQLRINERRTLNILNKDKNRATISLIQAQLGSLTVQDFTLSQDTTKIFRVGQRVTKCLVEFLWDKDDFETLLTAMLISKCFKAHLWENSKYLTRQLEGIGPALSNAFVNAGITSFEKIQETNPRELELIVNRHPPFGNQLRDNVAKLPKYELSIEQVAKYSSERAELAVTVCLANPESVKCNKTGQQYISMLLIGDEDNHVILNAKVSDRLLVKDGGWRRRITVQRANKGNDLNVNLISENWVGLDVQSTYTPYYTDTREGSYVEQDDQSNAESSTHKYNEGPVQECERRSCFHRCLNKAICGHECCKSGIPVTNRRSVKREANVSRLDYIPPAMGKYMNGLKTKLQILPTTPSIKNMKSGFQEKPSVGSYMKRFAYTPQQRLQLYSNNPGNPQSPRTPSAGSVAQKTPRGWEDLEGYTKYREECQENQDFWEESTLPDLIPGKLDYPHDNRSNPIQIIEWDSSEESDEYGNFRLDCTPPQQPEANHPAYTPEDFQDSEDEDAVLLKRGQINLPTFTRDRRYVSTKYPQPNQQQELREGQQCATLQHNAFAQQIRDDRQFSTPQNNAYGQYSIGEETEAKMYKIGSFQNAEFKGKCRQQQNVGYQTADDFSNDQSCQREAFYRQRCETEDGLMSTGQGYYEGVECQMPKNKMNMTDNQGDQLCMPVGGSKEGDPGNRINQKSFRNTTRNEFMYTPRRIGRGSDFIQTGKASGPVQTKAEHRQGQVFAWPATPKNSDLTKHLGLKTQDVERNGSSHLDRAQGGADSQSKSPSIPRVKEFVFAKHMYTQSLQQKRGRFPVRPMLPKKTSPSFSSDGDEEFMNAYVDDMERNLGENEISETQPRSVMMRQTDRVTGSVQTLAHQADPRKLNKNIPDQGVIDVPLEENNKQSTSRATKPLFAFVSAPEKENSTVSNTSVENIEASRPIEGKAAKPSVTHNQDMLNSDFGQQCPTVSHKKDFFSHPHSQKVVESADFTSIFDGIF